MARRGRKRSTAKREPNGRVLREPKAAISPELLEQRARLVGEANAKDPRAGSALGVLVLTGIITDCQYEGGLAFAGLHGRWASLAGVGKRYVAVTERGTGEDAGEASGELAALHRINEAMRAVRGCGAPGLAMAAIDSIVLDDWLPPWHAGAQSEVAQRALTAFRLGLDALARFFKIRDRQAA